MKITDGKKTVKIEIRRFDGAGLGEDMSADYFEAASLPYDEETDTYKVDDVDYCIDMANDPEEGARCVIGEDGEAVLDENIMVFVEEV